MDSMSSAEGQGNSSRQLPVWGMEIPVWEWLRSKPLACVGLFSHFWQQRWRLDGSGVGICQGGALRGWLNCMSAGCCGKGKRTRAGCPGEACTR